MDNKSFLENLKFSITDKSLHFYLYNWRCPKMSPDKSRHLQEAPERITVLSLSQSEARRHFKFEVSDWS
ncbi:Glycylpeptide N-tetradecanoyltransferase 2 [Liparis tanakae]|uniref:Glycylpeptide N-tetradecanoyltransferase 2 n=1 Tax=Liparis tanakae TaxID=230148 RepID=A0A4Z2FDS4_9TELE|nr:Glycylpeptide N-tetradecanoyltransferase 2 [Liparis tanakae]